MNEEQIAELTSLVERYVAAHRERIILSDGETRKLWASRPVRSEYAAVQAFLQALSACRKRYADETVEELGDDLLTAALENPDNADREVQALAGALARPVATRLYVPLEGIATEGDEYRVGALNLVRMSDELFEERIIEGNAQILRENPRYNTDQQAAIVEMDRERLASLRGRVCAEIPTSIDIPRTFAFARKRAVVTLCDFLQFAASFFLADDDTLNISWATDVRGTIWRHAFATSDGAYKRSNSYVERRSVAQPLTINAYTVRRIEELGLARIADLVGRESSCEYDELLQTAVRWFSKGEREEHPDDRKLSYVTAVDLFFSQPGRGATKRICRGFAFAVAAEEGVPWAARYMFHAFASRSATSHEGQLDILSAEELRSLRFHVQTFILAMLRQPFQTKKDVRRWIASCERALPVPIRVALREATDWKRIETEQYVLSVTNCLSRLSLAGLFDQPRARDALALIGVLRDAVRNGGQWVTELVPIAGRMSKANESIAGKLERATATRRDAVIYLNTTMRTFGLLLWVAQAMREPPREL